MVTVVAGRIRADVQVNTTVMHGTKWIEEYYAQTQRFISSVIKSSRALQPSFDSADLCVSHRVRRVLYITVRNTDIFLRIVLLEGVRGSILLA